MSSMPSSVVTAMDQCLAVRTTYISQTMQILIVIDTTRILIKAIHISFLDHAILSLQENQNFS